MPRILLLLLCLVLQKQPTADKQDTRKPENKPATNQTVPEPRQQKPEAIVTQARPVESQVHAKSHEEQDRTQTVKEINDTLLVVFTGFLAIVGFLQWKTLRGHEKWMKENVKIAKNAADAALLNAQAAIATVRPWVVISVKQKPDLELTFSAFNTGKTPAEIVAYSAEQVFIDNPNALPVPPQYGGQSVPAVRLLVPSSGRPDGSELDMLVHARPLIRGYGGGMTIGWENARNACVFYFRVVYRDFVPRTANLPDYETRMCFWYTPEKLDPIVGGPKEYNHHT